jgi:TRAP-type C4-dicarboxylate transport system substrate-binding protein
LQTGQFDGQENPIATIQASKFFQVQKYLTLSGHVYDPVIVFISPDVFGDLSDADKAAFVAVAKMAGDASRKFAGEAQAKGVAALESSGMQVTKEIVPATTSRFQPWPRLSPASRQVRRGSDQSDRNVAST